MTKSLPEKTNTKFSIMRKIQLGYFSCFVFAILFFGGLVSPVVGHTTSSQFFLTGFVIIEKGMDTQSMSDGIKSIRLTNIHLQPNPQNARSIDDSKAETGIDFKNENHRMSVDLMKGGRFASTVSFIENGNDDSLMRDPLSVDWFRDTIGRNVMDETNTGFFDAKSTKNIGTVQTLAQNPERTISVRINTRKDKV